MAIFENTDQFLGLFDDVPGDHYFDVVHLQDRRVAFSVKRHYPADIRYSPAQRTSGEPDNVAAIWIIYEHPSETDGGTDQTIVPIQIRVANMSLYRMQHFDYDYEDELSPSRDEVERSQATPKPVDLDYENEYYFDHSENTFIDKKFLPIASTAILDQVFEEHCDTVHLLRGLRLRLSLAGSARLTGVLGLVIDGLIAVLKVGFGRTLEEDDTISSMYKGYPRSALKKLGEDSGGCQGSCRLKI